MEAVSLHSILTVFSLLLRVLLNSIILFPQLQYLLRMSFTMRLINDLVNDAYLVNEKSSAVNTIENTAHEFLLTVYAIGFYYLLILIRQ